MTILSAILAPDPLELILPPLFLAIGAAAAVAMGVFRRGSIVGPVRLEDNDPLEPLAVAIGGGMMVYFYGSLLALQRLPGGHGGPATAPDDTVTQANVVVDLLARAGAVAVIVTLLLLWYRQPWRLGFSLKRIPRGVATGLLSLLMVLPLMMVVLLATSQVLPPDAQYVHPYLKLLGQSQDAVWRDLILLSILIAAPLSEELSFRGCVQTALSSWISRHVTRWPPSRTRWLAVVLTSMMFAMAHSDWWSRPPIFVLSLCLGYSYERTGNLWAPITIHAAFNASQAWLFGHSNWL